MNEMNKLCRCLKITQRIKLDYLRISTEPDIKSFQVKNLTHKTFRAACSSYFQLRMLSVLRDPLLPLTHGNVAFF